MPVSKFIDHVSKKSIDSGGRPFKRESIKIYPRDWYPCFEQEHFERISKMEELLPFLEKESKNINLVLSDTKPFKLHDKKISVSKKLFL